MIIFSRVNQSKSSAACRPLQESKYPPSRLLEEMATSEEDNSGKEGRWTAEEHRKFVEAYHSVGRDWKQIQEAVGTRTLQQVRSHGQKYFLKLRRQRHAVSSRSPLSLMQQQNALMRGYLQAIANVNTAFFAELQKLQQEGTESDKKLSE
jgi:SHAQKYF class myb-like DNA-binding protein